MPPLMRVFIQRWCSLWLTVKDHDFTGGYFWLLLLKGTEKQLSIITFKFRREFYRIFMRSWEKCLYPPRALNGLWKKYIGSCSETGKKTCTKWGKWFLMDFLFLFLFLERAIQLCLWMYSLCSTLLPLPPALKLFFKGFDKSVAKVSAFIVTSVSAFSERLFLCYLVKFTSVSIRRTLTSAAMYQKGRGNYFFSPNFILFWKVTEAFQKKESK